MEQIARWDQLAQRELCNISALFPLYTDAASSPQRCGSSQRKMSSSSENPESICTHCGRPVPAGTPLGLCPQCLLAAGALSEAGDGPRSFTPPTIEEMTARFPQLEILEMLGRGGMGVVYKARQKALHRMVALKILPPALGEDPSFADRFAREARSLAQLNHPGIVTLYEFGRTEDGLFFILMEFVDGVNLRLLLAGGRIAPREALAIVPELCDALQYAHDRGIVHRDIKPENILLDRRGHVKIADFGVAKMVGGVSDTVVSGVAVEAMQTEAGKVMGTPSYMAPEQTANGGDVDHRADIYALGVVFYQMLTGELPGQRIQPPSRRFHMDVRLDEIVLRALERQPELRYQQASHVKTAVETVTGTSTAPGAKAETIAAETLERDYTLDIGSCLRRGWALVRSDFWPLVGITALVLALLGTASSSFRENSSGVTSVLAPLIIGPLLGGLCLHFLKKIRGEPTNIETVFSGFRTHFLQLFLGGFVALTLIGLGFFCLVLPGVYLFVAWMFALPLIIDKRLDFWPAMELSRKTISRHWFNFLGFIVILGLLNLAGLVALAVGLFIAAPVAVAALMYAYEDIFAADEPAGVPPVEASAPAPTSPPITAKPA